MKMVSAGAAGLDYRDGSPAASRSEEEDRELVLRRRGPTALDLRLLRRRQVAFVDPSLEVETLDAVRRNEARRGALRRRRRLGAEAEAVERGLAFELLDAEEDAGLDRAEGLEVTIVGLGGRGDGPRRRLGEFLKPREPANSRRKSRAIIERARVRSLGGPGSVFKNQGRLRRQIRQRQPTRTRRQRAK